MAKVFFKSMFVMFLWLILFINIIYAFNIGNQVTLGGFHQGDYSNKYFGMSTLIEFIKYIDIERDFPFLSNLRTWINDIDSRASSLLSLTWNDVFSIPINNIGDFFYMIGQLFVMIGQSLLSIFLTIFFAILWMVYYAFYFVSFIKLFWQVIGGGFYSEVPTTPLTEYIPQVTQSTFCFWFS